MKKSELSQYLAGIGSKGGKETAKRMTKAEKVARAKKAANARHAKKGGLA
jgi:hypothetical protein